MQKVYFSWLIIAILLTTTPSILFAQDGKYNLDIKNSEVKWAGYHRNKSYEHTGTIKTKSGSISFQKDNLTAGEVVIDMNTLQDVDFINDGDKKLLTEHLKSDDFFGVNKFPEAKLVVKKSKLVKKGFFNITADLTIKDITKEIVFDAEGINTYNNDYKISSVVRINRLDYNIAFNTAIKDGMVDNEIKLDITLIFKTSGKLSVDTDNSEVEWTGYHFGQSYEHWGTIKIKSGAIAFENEMVTGGNFSIDMNSLDNTDITNEGEKEKLVQHLKSPDFFDAQKFPEASLVIKKSEKSSKGNLKITADMTIKGITKEIIFDAQFATTYDSSVKFTAEFTFNRHDHKVMFPLEVEDAMIDKEVKLDILLICK